MSNDDGDKASPVAFVTPDLDAPIEPTATSMVPADAAEVKVNDKPNNMSESPAESALPKDNPETMTEPEPEPRDDAPDTATKGKRKAPPAGLQLQDVPPPDARRSIEIDIDHLSQARSRTSTLSQPFTPSMHHAPDSPTTSLIGTLRSQLEMYVQQTEQLNAKLVAAVSKHADLEDQVFDLQTDKDQLTRNNGELARAKAQWEESMNTGLLVERSQIRDEMQRLAAGLVEEERKRGTAEEKRKQVEDEVDELSATLFDQANTMVATERMARAQAELRLKDTEDSLAVAEAAVRDMQTHMQSLTTIVSAGPSAPHIPRRYLCSHPPYDEFKTLLAHLRAARPSALSRKRSNVRELFPAPLVASIVQQPFIARCITEDYEATLRLEQAADLGWVSRRSVSSAILSGDLLIEPVGSAALGPPESLSCALCGRAVFGGGAAHKGLMKYFSTTNAGSTAHLGSNIYVFRVATQEDAKSYPLCKNGWCLERLRAACALWHFVRTGIVHPVWFGEDHDASPATPKTASTAADTDDGTPVQIDLNRTPPEADKLTVSPVPVPQRSASAPMAAPIAITVENLASAEYRRPALPPQRKSAWGLGSFGLGSGGKSSSGWTNWGSRPSTPASPAVPSMADQRSVSAGVLGAPITLEAEKGEPVIEKKDEPVEKELVVENVAEKAEAVAEKTPVEETVDDKTAPAADEKVGVPEVADPTPVQRSDSRTSHRSGASTDHSFATPTGDNASLPDVNGKAKEVEVSTAMSSPTKAAGLELKTSVPGSPSKTAPGSPSKSASPSKPGTPVNGVNASPTRPTRAAGRQPPPPPLPKRSERRALNTPTPPITPTVPGDPSKTVTPPAATEEVKAPEAALAEEVKVPEAAPAEEVKVPEAAPAEEVKVPATAPAEEVKVSETAPAEEVKPGAPEAAIEKAEIDDTPLVDTAASASAATAEAKAPSTPTAATAEDAVTPTAGSSPARIPPPRHPLAIMRSPATSPRSSLDNPRPMPEARPPSLPLRKSMAERSVSISSTTSHASHASRASQASHATVHWPEHDGDGRSFLTGEGWEARTWRQVVRLKEDMWRARVGAIDDDE
ncbi:hypothetical protein CspHIS471_0407090 [Cutaneotrichosporon sp. HIS471]|nr:hypothetical protein CspHIS471_0407090 [Cutaneotrichosporon sp. HIS471]